MNNFIEYFYNIKADNIEKIDNYYSFYYLNNLYRLYINNDNINTNIYYLDKNMLENSLMSEIILNKDSSMISSYEGINYILLKINCNPNKDITLEEINYLSNIMTRNDLKINWGILWSNKIDYLEELIYENGKKYPIVVDSFNYFVGLAENAISYYNNIHEINSNHIFYISHKIIRPYDKVDSIYDPLNIIFDHKVRDIAEYIKNSFWNNNTSIFNELDNYLSYEYLSIYDVKILIARILYPSFYFDTYEDIFINNKDEKIINNYISRLNEYENYLASIIDYFKRLYPVDEVLWLKKNNI